MGRAVKYKISVTAFKKVGTKVAGLTTYTFTPRSLAVVPVPNPVAEGPMIQARLPESFENVYRLTVKQEVSVSQTLGIDNLEYTVSTQSI